MVGYVQRLGSDPQHSRRRGGGGGRGKKGRGRRRKGKGRGRRKRRRRKKTKLHFSLFVSGKDESISLNDKPEELQVLSGKNEKPQKNREEEAYQAGWTSVWLFNTEDSIKGSRSIYLPEIPGHLVSSKRYWKKPTKIPNSCSLWILPLL